MFKFCFIVIVTFTATRQQFNLIPCFAECFKNCIRFASNLFWCSLSLILIASRLLLLSQSSLPNLRFFLIFSRQNLSTTTIIVSSRATIFSLGFKRWSFFEILMWRLYNAQRCISRFPNILKSRNLMYSVFFSPFLFWKLLLKHDDQLRTFY